MGKKPDGGKPKLKTAMPAVASRFGGDGLGGADPAIATPRNETGQKRASGVATRILPAMPSLVVRDPPLVSCITASRNGFRVRPPHIILGFVLEVTVISYEADNNKEWQKCQRPSQQAIVSNEGRERGFGNHLDGMGAALTQAKYLAELFGNSPLGGRSFGQVIYAVSSTRRTATR